MALDKVYRRDGNIVRRRVLDDTLLVPVRGELADLQRIFALNATAQQIWTALDGEHDLAAVRDDLVTRFAVEPAPAETDLLEFVAQLSAVGLIAEVR
ncbi:MAG: PqqD family protein [Anaerolineales bacterium]|nr:PqqD family protein [Anaerolineales bacterium]